MIRLLIDVGNTNIKLAWVDDAQWSPVVTLPSASVCDLNGYLDEYCGPRVQQVWVSNVAGESLAQQIVVACELRHWTPYFIKAEVQQCGVRNGYECTVQLGCDRWAALIAAWHQVGAACLVVNSGTATTIDALSDEGEFIGGLIMPGLKLMQDSLSASTAMAKSAVGAHSAFPTNTADALFNGAIQATLGAIQRQQAQLEVAVPVLLSGGAAALLSPQLAMAPMTHLVLQGLLLIAQEMDDE